MLKRVALISLGVLLVPVAIIGGGFAVAFSGNKPLTDGLELAPGARQVVDGYVSFFVLETAPGQLALIDCGNDDQGAALEKELKRRGLEKSAVKDIFLTHGHPDHTAGCHLFPTANVYGFSEDVQLANGNEAAKGPITRFAKAPKEKVVVVTRELTDGQELAFEKLVVKAIKTPGHTGGSAVFVSQQVAYFGDSASGGSEGQVKPAPWIFTDDGAQNRASIKATLPTLQGLKVNKLTFSHTGALEGLAALEKFAKEN